MTDAAVVVAIEHSDAVEEAPIRAVLPLHPVFALDDLAVGRGVDLCERRIERGEVIGMHQIAHAHRRKRRHLFGRIAEQPLHPVIGVDRAPRLAVVDVDRGRRGEHDRFELACAVGERARRADMRSDVVTRNEDAGHVTVRPEQRLVDAVDQILVLIDAPRHGFDTLGLAAGENAIEQRGETLLDRFGHLGQRLVDRHASGSQAAMLDVFEHQPVVRPLEQRHESRCLFEHVAQARLPHCGTPRGEECLGRFLTCAKHADDAPLRIEHRCVRKPEMRFLRPPVANQHEHDIVHVRRYADIGAVEDRTEIGHNVAPKFRVRRAERRRMPVATDFGIGVVVDHRLRGAPRDQHRLRRSKH